MLTIDEDIPQAETILSGIEDSIDAITLDEDKKPAARKTPPISNLTGTIAAINLKQDDMDQSMDSMSLHTAGPISDSVYALMLATEEEEEFNKQQRQSAGLTQTSFKQVKMEATIPDSVKVSPNQHQSAWNRQYTLNTIRTIRTYLRLTTGSDVIPVHLTIERQFQLYDTLGGGDSLQNWKDNKELRLSVAVQYQLERQYPLNVIMPRKNHLHQRKRQSAPPSIKG